MQCWCCAPQAPRDSLDFCLKSVYNHHEEFLQTKSQTLYQRETVSADQGWVLELMQCKKWKIKKITDHQLPRDQPCLFFFFFYRRTLKSYNKQEAPQNELERDIRMWVSPQRCSIYSIEGAIGKVQLYGRLYVHCRSIWCVQKSAEANFWIKSQHEAQCNYDCRPHSA